jgi:RNA polymerase sigma-70 factor, ECF subfamily
LTIQKDLALGHGPYPTTDGLKEDRDRQLVEAHLRHDGDAFAVIVDDHRDALLAQARRMLGPDGAVEDVVQETFERALKYLHRFGRSGDYRLGAWLSQILKSVVQNHWERKARDLRSLQAGAAHATNEADVADRVGDPVTAAALNQAVRELPENQRAVFVMREVVGLPYADVAEVLNISEDNARARVSRSKDHLRKTTSGIRSAVGALIALPGIRAINNRFGSRSTKGAGRNRGHVLGTSDRIATQVVASQPMQAVLTVASSAPRGTLVFGLAATVATLGASTAVLAAGTGAQVPALPPSAMASSQSHGVAITGGTAAVPPSAPSGSNALANYSWVNPSSSAVSTTGLAAATCSSTNGVTPPSGGLDVGTPLGVANAQAVGQGPAVDLATVGPSFSFVSPATITPYGALGGATSVSLATNVCLSSSGAWFTANLSGLGSNVELQASLQEVDSSSGQVGYVFRGVLGPAASLTGPLTGAIQFVVDVIVAEPENTAQLTLVFLGPNSELGNPITTATGPPVPPPATTDPPATTTSTTDTPAPASEPGAGAPTTLPTGDQGGSGDAGVGAFQSGGIAPFGQGGSDPLPPALP